jgi:hypothetical protein
MKRRQLVSLLGAALPPFAALPAYAAGPADGCAVPVARDDGWPVAAGNDDKLIDQDYGVRAGQVQFGVFRDLVRATLAPG